MPGISLSLTVSDIRQCVGDFLGYGRGEDAGMPAWDSKMVLDLKEILQSGFNRVYNPAMILGTQYEWSFLKLTTTLTLASGITKQLLPKDFKSLDGEVYLESSTVATFAIKMMNDAWLTEIQARNSDSDMTGSPQYVAVQSERKVGTGEQRKSLLVYPIPDESYTIRFRYTINPEHVLENEYPYGASEHSELLKESCLAVAEQRFDDRMHVHTAAFKELLIAAVNADRQLKGGSLGSMNKPERNTWIYRDYGNVRAEYV